MQQNQSRMKMVKAFFAYPSIEPDAVHAIHDAKAKLALSRRELDIHLWGENDISGPEWTRRADIRFEL